MKIVHAFFDSDAIVGEQLPRRFCACFDSILEDGEYKTRVSVDGVPIGDVIDDNSRESDGYRFHDVFHYSFATLLGWSPCTRALMKRKRKSGKAIDRFEDGARATITEEAISLLVFNLAKRERFFEGKNKVSSTLLQQIKHMTEPFEVKARSEEEWEVAILKSYSLFRSLVRHNGGCIHYDMSSRSAIFQANQAA